jgi:glycosyltransferase involved in cell wall biosynthesis
MPQSIKASIALITAHSWVSISSPVLNTAHWYLDHGFEVWLYLPFLPEQPPQGFPGIEPREGLHLVGFQPRLHYQAPFRWLKRFTSIRWPLDFFDDLEFGWVHRRPPPHLRTVIAYDHQGLERAIQVTRFWKKPIVYHNLEFLETLGFRKVREQRNAKLARCVLTQDDNRANVLSELLGVTRDRIWVSYNSGRGGTKSERHRLFHARFNIRLDKRIVLFIGSIIPEHGIYEVLQSLPSLPDTHCLILHGWVPDPKIKEAIEKSQLLFPEKLFWSSDLIPASRKHQLFASADIGLVLFTGEGLNYRFAAGSAGKLFDCLQNGTPMLGNPIAGMETFLEGNGAGLTRPLDAHFFEAVAEIERDTEGYRARAFHAFGQYAFDPCFAALEERISRL